MADALERVAQTAEEIGVAVDDGAFEGRKAFYASLGFTSLDSRPGRMFIPTATIRRLLPRGG